MPRLLLHYYTTLLQFNLPFSVAAGFGGMIIQDNKLSGFIGAFNLTLLTGGFLLSLYFYELRYKRQYYFYNNRGLSRIKLIGSTLAANLTLALVLYALTFAAHA